MASSITFYDTILFAKSPIRLLEAIVTLMRIYELILRTVSMVIRIKHFFSSPFVEYKASMHMVQAIKWI